LQAKPDYFEFLGLPAGRLDVDLADLEKRYYQLSRKFHPDLFARKSAQERAGAEESSAVLNDAYRTLKDPVRRAEYVMSRNGLDASQATAPPDLLEEVFELNMALEELRGGDESARAGLVEAQEKFSRMRSEVDQQLLGEFAKNDEGSLSRIRAILNRRNYIRNLLRDVEKSLGS
jgi:molecular chaperone HscB